MLVEEIENWKEDRKRGGSKQCLEDGKERREMNRGRKLDKGERERNKKRGKQKDIKMVKNHKK